MYMTVPSYPLRLHFYYVPIIFTFNTININIVQIYFKSENHGNNKSATVGSFMHVAIVS